jgi:hypothetical protein
LTQWLCQCQYWCAWDAVGERAPVVVCHRQAVLLGTALLAFPPLAVAASYLVGLTGTLALTVGVVRHRPDPVTGWRLLVADAWEKGLDATMAALAASSCSWPS